MSAPPIPRPPTTRTAAPSDHPLYAEFAHIRQASVGDRAAVFLGRYSHGMVTATIVWEGMVANSNLAVLDTFVGLVHEARHLGQPLVVVPSTGLMRQLAEIGFDDPHVVVGARTGHSYLGETLELQQAWLDQVRAERPTRRRLVATDAAVGLGRGSAGIACVDGRGSYRSEHFASRDVLYCELRAISLALGTFTGALDIVTDSRLSVRLIAGQTRPKTRAIARLLAQVHRQLAGRESTVEWVRGHNGHLLNETADRLALAARRRIEFGTSRKVHRQICARIIDTLRAGGPEEA